MINVWVPKESDSSSQPFRIQGYGVETFPAKMNNILKDMGHIFPSYFDTYEILLEVWENIGICEKIYDDF